MENFDASLWRKQGEAALKETEAQLTADEAALALLKDKIKTGKANLKEMRAALGIRAKRAPRNAKVVDLVKKIVCEDYEDVPLTFGEILASAKKENAKITEKGVQCALDMLLAQAVIEHDSNDDSYSVAD